MKRMKEIWDDIYQNSTMSAQILRDNAAKFHKDKLLLNLIEVRDGNYVELEVIQIRAIEPVRIEENVEDNENNEEEIMENINKDEDKEIRIMKLRFEEIRHSLTASTKENIEERVTGEAGKKGNKSRDFQSKQNIGTMDQPIEIDAGMDIK